MSNDNSFPPSESRTVLGPLTTTFTPPSSCFTAQAGCLSCSRSTAWLAQTCNPDASYGGPNDDPKCWPPVTASAPSPQPALHGWGFYSPGVQCPSGFTTACHATAGGSSDYSAQFQMNPGETAAGCCPTGYACNYSSAGGQTCQSIAGVGKTITAEACSVGNIKDLTTVALPWQVVFVEASATTDPSSTVTATFTDYHFYAPMIELRWQSSDIASLSSSSSSASSTGSSSASSSGSSSQKPSAAGGPTSSMASQTSQPTVGSASDKDANGGLSTGAKVAIGVVIPVVVLAAIAIAALLLMRRRKNKSKNVDTAQPYVQPPQHYSNQSPELHGSPVHEMATNTRPELQEKPSTGNVRHELPGEAGKYA